VKLDPEEWVIAAALDRAELEDAHDRGASARIEFKPEGRAKVTITTSRELVEQARTLDFDDVGTLRRGAPVGRPRVVVGGRTSPALALTRLPLPGSRPYRFRATPIANGRADHVNRERDRAKPGEGDGQREPPLPRGGSICWPPSEAGAGSGRVRQSGPIREEGREVLAHWRASAANAVIWSIPSSAK
jgi:hypothetical protein